jgi:hypothetical protein
MKVWEKPSVSPRVRGIAPAIVCQAIVITSSSRLLAQVGSSGRAFDSQGTAHSGRGTGTSDSFHYRAARALPRSARGTRRIHAVEIHRGTCDPMPAGGPCYLTTEQCPDCALVWGVDRDPEPSTLPNTLGCRKTTTLHLVISSVRPTVRRRYRCVAIVS